VSAELTRESLERTIRVLLRRSQRRFGIAAPRILVAALNPHGGEGRLFRREEIDVIGPVLETCGRKGMRLIGPLPADTLFVRIGLAGRDCALAMYHDQGLPVAQVRDFGRGVNITLGLADHPHLGRSRTAIDTQGLPGAGR